jgi:uncharacterized protein YndB with AHSA1/START domain
MMMGAIKRVQGITLRAEEPKQMFDWFRGLELGGQWREDGDEGWIWGSVGLHFSAADEQQVGMSFQTEDLPGARTQVEEAGAELLTEILEMPEYNYRYFRFRDPFGLVHEVGHFEKPAGTAEVDGDGMGEERPEDNVEKVIQIEAPVDKVWELITDPEQYTNWYMPLVHAEFEVGGRWNIGKDEDNIVIHGIVKAIEPKTMFAHTFQFSHSDEAPSLVTWTLEEMTPSITQLRMVHSRFAEGGTTRPSVDGGWVNGLSAIKTFCELGRKMKWE